MKTQSTAKNAHESKVQQYAKWLSPSESYSLNAKDSEKQTKH